MRIETTGVVMNAICSVQTEHCVAREIAPVTVVWELPARRQVNVCQPCLEDQIRSGHWSVESAKVKTRADIEVYDGTNRLQLVVEVRRPLSSSSLSWKTWVRRIHRNLYAHSGIPLSYYFLVVGFPNYYALWGDTPGELGRRPDFEGELGPLFDRYIARERFALPTAITGVHAQRAVELWLVDIMKSDRPPQDANLRWISASGLFGAIHHGRVRVARRLATAL
jgi:hypothetical protein